MHLGLVGTGKLGGLGRLHDVGLLALLEPPPHP